MAVNKGFEERERALENGWARGEDAKRIAALKAQLAEGKPIAPDPRDAISETIAMRKAGLDVGGEGHGAHAKAVGGKQTPSQRGAANSAGDGLPD